MVGTRSRYGVIDRTVGTLLQHARLSRKLSFDAVAQELRIPPAQLRALEEGDLTVFSAEVYARGAYVKYAAYLGVTNPDSYQALLRAVAGVRERVTLRVPQPASWLERMITPYRVLVFVLGCGAVMITGYIGWHVQAFVRQPRLELFSPMNGIVTATEVAVEGRVEEGVVVTINGEAMLLRDDGSFATVLSLRPGINVLSIEARGAAGTTRIIQRELLVPRTTVLGG